MITNYLVGAFYLGLIYMLVQPSAPTTEVIVGVTNVMSNLIQAAISGGINK